MADLLAEITSLPTRLDREVSRIMRGPREQTGERIVRFVLETLDRPAARKRGIAMLRKAMSSKVTSALVTSALTREVLPRIAAELDGADADRRAALATSQLAGLIITRHVLKVPAVADASVDELVASAAPAVQLALFG